MTLKYPLLLVHGMGFRDNRYVGYWGRIPKALEQKGCAVFFGCQDSNAAVETNGEQLAKRICEILKETGSEKVNILAHSKGGLDSRYAISSLKMNDKVASLTTVSTPHNGSKTIDRLMKLPRRMMEFGCACTDVWFRLLGDENPHTYQVLCEFTTEAAMAFNAQNPDHADVFYQSYAFVMNKPSSDMLMWLPSLVVSRVEGENDGLLTPDSVRWGEFKGVIRSAGKRGISHLDEIDLRRKPLHNLKGKDAFDIVDFYVEIVEDLAEKGF